MSGRRPDFPGPYVCMKGNFSKEAIDEMRESIKGMMANPNRMPILSIPEGGECEIEWISKAAMLAQSAPMLLLLIIVGNLINDRNGTIENEGYWMFVHHDFLHDSVMGVLMCDIREIETLSILDLLAIIDERLT